jgi:hypothetical protein
MFLFPLFPLLFSKKKEKESSKGERGVKKGISIAIDRGNRGAIGGTASCSSRFSGSVAVWPSYQLSLDTSGIATECVTSVDRLKASAAPKGFAGDATFKHLRVVAARTGSHANSQGRPLARLITHFCSRFSLAVRIKKTPEIDYTFLFVLRDATHLFPSLIIPTKVTYHVGDSRPDR